MKDPHAECAKMHKHGYCLCVSVECFKCDRSHPPHRACNDPITEQEISETKVGVDNIIK